MTINDNKMTINFDRLANKKKYRENSMRNEAAEIEVLGQVSADPTLSTRKMSRITGVSTRTIRRTFKHHKFHPYKLHLVQGLSEDDYDRRLEFCEIMSEKIINNPNCTYNICFSDECSFFVDGTVNRHNCRYWADTNPRIFREVHTQHPQKINVWAGVFRNHIIGPFFLPGNLTGEMYSNLLEDAIHPTLVEVMENDANGLGEDVIFQQDGAPPHYTLLVRQYLNGTFPERWIGRRGFIEWPARSPDLSPLDYFLWGHLKTKIYATKVESLEDLRNRIVNECHQITPNILNNVRRHFEQRLYYCMEVNGEHFEHLLN